MFTKTRLGFMSHMATAALLYGQFIEAANPVTRRIMAGSGVRNYHKGGSRTYCVPGVGDRECERRRRQIAAKSLRVYNGLELAS